MQGDGHDPAVHDFGLDAEQVHEAQIILADGKLVIASPCQNPDLFFVIRGEGGSTYEVVVFTVIKAHSTNIVSVQKLSFALLTPTDMPAFVSALQTISRLLRLRLMVCVLFRARRSKLHHLLHAHHCHLRQIQNPPSHS